MLLRALADRISEVSYDALPAEAVEVAKRGILDTVGVTLAGARDETTAVVARRCATPPRPVPRSSSVAPSISTCSMRR